MTEPQQTLQTLPTDTDVELSEATKVIVKNYTTAHEWKEQLKALQEWLREQKKLADKAAK